MTKQRISVDQAADRSVAAVYPGGAATEQVADRCCNSDFRQQIYLPHFTEVA